MNLSPTEQIRRCRSLQEIQQLWQSNIDWWSQLPKDQAMELIRVKDAHKAKLELFEEWSYWHEERAAICQYDGGLSREEAEDVAREGVSQSCQFLKIKTDVAVEHIRKYKSRS